MGDGLVEFAGKSQGVWARYPIYILSRESVSRAGRGRRGRFEILHGLSLKNWRLAQIYSGRTERIIRVYYPNQARDLPRKKVIT